MSQGKASIVDARANDVQNTSIAANLRDLRLALLLGFTIVVWLVFNFVITDGYVLTARNLSTLSVQMAVTAIIAIGMTLLLVGREIDLSAGAVMALVVVVIFQLQVHLSWSTPLTVAAAIACGAAIGLFHGVIRAWFYIPSFIITLAGLLWIRGIAFIIPDAQTLSGASESFYGIANNHISPMMSGVLIALLSVPLLIKFLASTRSKEAKMAVTRLVEALQLFFIVLFSAGAFWVFTNRGLPYPTVILAAIAVVIHWTIKNTDLGRHIYAVGGNPQAAKRVGINVRLIVVLLFVIMGVLTAVSGVIQSSLLDAAPPGVGELVAMSAISAAIIGGTNLFGGQGSVPGTLAGSLLMASISNGLGLAGVNTFYQMVVTGFILLVAVGMDSYSRRKELRV